MKLRYLWLGILFTSTAMAQMQDMPGMDMHGPGAASPADAKFMREMMEGMKRMDHGMASAPMTGNPDHDFASMMIPHHQGAIAMAKSELKYGKDPVLRQLAKEIIEAQKSEIALMERWLKQNAAAAKK
jgi:uncharacterized protein (DUF305 family)